MGARLQATLSIFLFFGCAAFAGAGATVAFINPTRPRVVGFAIMTIAAAIGIGTVRFWRNILPGIFACGALNALIIVVDEHALNSPQIPVSRPEGILLVAGMVAASALTAYANHQGFTLLGKLSASGIFLSCAMLFSGFDLQPIFMATGFACAAIPAATHFLGRWHGRTANP